MSYELRFREEALKEWRKLDDSVRSQFKKSSLRFLAPRSDQLPSFRAAIAATRSSFVAQVSTATERYGLLPLVA